MKMLKKLYIVGCITLTATITLSSQAQNSSDNSKGDTTEKIRLEYENQHPVFQITPEQYKSLFKLGEDNAKKGRKLTSITDKYRKVPNWTRGKRGRANAAVWCLEMEGGNVAMEVYRATQLYEKPKIADFIETEGAAFNYVNFEVVIVSQPKIGKNQNAELAAALAGIADPTNAGNYNAQVQDQVLADADEAEVKAIKFVLSDDKGNNYTAEEGSTEGQSESGTTTFIGVLPKRVTGTVDTTVNATANAYGAGGYVSANVYGRANSTYQRTEFEAYSEQHPYFQARYNARFPLFDADGKSRINPDVKQLTLRIITEKGEMDVVYKLPTLRKRK